MSAPIASITRSPLSDLADEFADGVLFDPEVPYARQANTRLLEAVSQAVEVGDAVARGDAQVREFDQTVSAGVSANLLESLVKLGSFTEASEVVGPIRRAFDISIRWAFGRPGPSEIPRELTVSRNSILAFDEAATFFRRRDPQPDTEISGQLIGNLDINEGDGVAIVRTMIATSAREKPRWRQIRVHLSESAYQVARRAHADRLSVRAIGDLRTAGRLELQNVRQFEALEETDGE